MCFVLATVWKNLIRLRRDPFSLIVALGIPLIMGGLMNIVFGGGAPNPHGVLMVDDEDGSFLSHAFTAGFRNGPLANMVTVETVKHDDGIARINRGEGSALLVIPKGLQDAYFANKPFQLELRTNPSQRILPQIIQESLSIMTESSRSKFAVLSQPGRLIDLDIRVKRAAQRPNFATFFFPSMIFMALLFMSNWLSSDIWRERAFGSLRRVAATPASLEAFLSGWLLFIAILMLGVAIAALAAARWAGVSLSNSGACIAWLVFSGLAFFELILFAKMYASSERTANVFGNLVILPLALIGGSFFPFETMPDWMAAIGRKMPNGWALTEFTKMLSGSTGPHQWLPAFATLAIVCAFMFFLNARRLRGFLV